MPAFAAASRKNPKRGFVGIETRARILDIDDHRIQIFENFLRRSAIGVLRSVNAVDRNSSDPITRVADIGRIQSSSNAVLRD